MRTLIASERSRMRGGKIQRVGALGKGSTQTPDIVSGDIALHRTRGSRVQRQVSELTGSSGSRRGHGASPRCREGLRPGGRASRGEEEKDSHRATQTRTDALFASERTNDADGSAVVAVAQQMVECGSRGRGTRHHRARSEHRQQRHQHLPLCVRPFKKNLKV